MSRPAPTSHAPETNQLPSDRADAVLLSNRTDAVPPTTEATATPTTTSAATSPATSAATSAAPWANRFPDVDLHEAKAFEAVFPDVLTRFMTDINFTTDADEVFDLLVGAGRACGLPLLIYDYCADATAAEPALYTKSNIPRLWLALERLTQGSNIGYARQHCAVKWTPGVGAHAFSDMYADYPAYQRKMRMAARLTGIRSGIGVPLRSADPNARASMFFCSRLTREACLDVVDAHGAVLTAIAWAGHTRVLQHAREGRALPVPLTARQAQYVVHLTDGLTDQQIAAEMGISHSGVRKFQAAVCRKLGVRRRSEIIAETQRRRILKDPEVDLSVGPEGAWDAAVEGWSEPDLRSLPCDDDDADDDEPPIDRDPKSFGAG